MPTRSARASISRAEPGTARATQSRSSLIDVADSAIASPVQVGRITALLAAFRGARLGEYATVALAVVVTRALVHLDGLRFNFELGWMVLSDPEDLRLHFLETIYYSHAYPPGLNVLAGLIEKLGGMHAPALAAAVFEILGIVLVGSFYYLVRASGFSSRASLGLALAFALIPQTLFFEHLYHHTYPSAALLCLALALFHYALSGRSFMRWFGFFAVCTALGWMRATFHLVWFAAMGGLAVLFSEKVERRRILTASLLPFLCL